MDTGQIVVSGIYFLEPCPPHAGIHSEWEIGRFVRVDGRVKIGATSSREWRIYFPVDPRR